MKITVEFIDHKGFWHLKIGKSKKNILQWIKQLAKGTAIIWLAPDHVHISQQYVTIVKRIENWGKNKDNS